MKVDLQGARIDLRNAQVDLRSARIDLRGARVDLRDALAYVLGGSDLIHDALVLIKQDTLRLILVGKAIIGR